MTEYNSLFHVLTFDKAECDVLQPKPQSGDGCHTLLQEGLDKR